MCADAKRLGMDGGDGPGSPGDGGDGGTGAVALRASDEQKGGKKRGQACTQRLKKRPELPARSHFPVCADSNQQLEWWDISDPLKMDGS